MYSDKWVKKNGAVAPSIWIEAIGSLSPQELRKGVDRCKENIFSGDAWAPDLADFLAMVHSITPADYDAAFTRCLAKSPEGRIEKWVYQHVYFNVKTSTDKEARAIHRRSMNEAMQLARAGKLKLMEEELKALPVNSVKNTNDLAREEYENRHGHKLNPRIQKIIDAKKHEA